MTARAIRSTGLTAWTDQQRAALDDCLRSVVDESVAAADGHQLDTWLCAVGRMGLDVRPYLERLATNREAVLSYFK